MEVADIQILYCYPLYCTWWKNGMKYFKILYMISAKGWIMKAPPPSSRIKTDRVKLQTHHCWKKLASIPQPKFTKSCIPLTGQTFSGNYPNHFKVTLDNIAIYSGSTYGHNIETIMMAQKEAIIPQT